MSRNNNNDNETSSEDEFIKPSTVDETKIKDLLPIELMHHIFSYLTSNELLQLRLVCSNWKMIVDDDQVLFCSNHILFLFLDLEEPVFKNIWKL